MKAGETLEIRVPGAGMASGRDVGRRAARAVERADLIEGITGDDPETEGGLLHAVSPL